MAFHVIPTNDDILHLETELCPCSPDVFYEGKEYPNGPIYGHNAVDGRDPNKKLSDRKWLVVEQ